MNKEVSEMKLIVETTGSFMLINTNGEEVRFNRPSVVTNSPFLESRMLKGQLKVLARGLPDKASDQEFAKALKESKGNKKLTVAAFCAEFGIDIDGNPLAEMEYKNLSDKEAKKAAKAAAKAAEQEAAKAAEDAAKADEDAEDGAAEGQK